MFDENTSTIVGITGENLEGGFTQKGNVYQLFVVPGGSVAQPTAINAAGQVVGIYADSSNVAHGFLLTGNTVKNIDDPSGVAGSTIVFDINDKGEIVGSWQDSSSVTHAFSTKDGNTFAVNLFGTHGMAQAFLRLLAQSRGAIVNVLSLAAVASVPFSPAYSISKAAAFSLTQSLRALWAGQGVRVHGVLAGPVNTDMARSLAIAKASPESVARAIFDGVEKEEEDIFPDPMSASIADGWRSGVAKALEHQFAAFTLRT